jgi:hypothetical protein
MHRDLALFVKKRFTIFFLNYSTEPMVCLVLNFSRLQAATDPNQ